MADRNELITSFEGRILGSEMHKGGYIHVPQEEAEAILKLLKEQEPRVMALEEVQNDCPDYVYLEWQNCCICCIKDEGESNKSVAYFVYGIEGSYFQFTWDTYGTKWRCWSAMPTRERRKAVKWN